ncbi:MAG: hypothetical protein PHV34_17185 [Verrucomicrobiae bacterium]|nr:hypothetical protein [Verrucomicrobiae bacterium]
MQMFSPPTVKAWQWLKKRWSQLSLWWCKWWFSLLCFSVGGWEIHHKASIDWPAAAVFLAGGIPFLLPLLAQYIDSWKVAGVEGKMKEDRSGKTQTADEPIFPKLSLNASRIIRTLWHFQKQRFGEDTPERWGLGLNILTPDYIDFARGRSELADLKYGFCDSRGFIFLRNEGITYCKEHREAIDKAGPFYTNFS